MYRHADPQRLLALLVFDMNSTDFPSPMDWPAPPTVTCSICNKPCSTIVLERGACVATYVCEEQHDTPHLAKRDASGEWDFGEVPF